jgi:hypothetical protein
VTEPAPVLQLGAFLVTAGVGLAGEHALVSLLALDRPGELAAMAANRRPE